MSRARIIKGVGREVNPLDGDKIVIELGLRAGKIAHIGASDIRTTAMTWTEGGVRSQVFFKSGAEARAHGGETFAGCETARRAALILYEVFGGRELDQAPTQPSAY